MKRIVSVTVIVLAGLALIVAMFLYWKREQWAPAFGGSNISVQLADTVRYQQNDPLG